MPILLVSNSLHESWDWLSLTWFEPSGNQEPVARQDGTEKEEGGVKKMTPSSFQKSLVVNGKF